MFSRHRFWTDQRTHDIKYELVSTTNVTRRHDFFDAKQQYHFMTTTRGNPIRIRLLYEQTRSAFVNVELTVFVPWPRERNRVQRQWRIQWDEVKGVITPPPWKFLMYDYCLLIIMKTRKIQKNINLTFFIPTPLEKKKMVRHCAEVNVIRVDRAGARCIRFACTHICLYRFSHTEVSHRRALYTGWCDENVWSRIRRVRVLSQSRGRLHVRTYLYTAYTAAEVCVFM
jgi:hypothetical protein